METAFKVAAVTVRVVLAVMEPEVIVMVVEPGATAVATFPTMLATAGLLECHDPAIGAGVGLSEEIATAVKVTVIPTVATGACCWMLMPSTAAVAPRVTTVVPVTPTHLALTVVVDPAVTPAIANPDGVTRESDPGGTDQVTTEVRSCEVPSE
jgi:hypothetical protein